MPCGVRDDGAPLQYRLVYSDRAVKNVSIRISRDGEVEVRSPRGVPAEFIEQLVQSKRKLILRALSERATLDEARSYYTLDYGYSTPLLGTDYPIIAEDDGGAVGVDSSRFGDTGSDGADHGSTRRSGAEYGKTRSDDTESGSAACDKTRRDGAACGNTRGGAAEYGSTRHGAKRGGIGHMKDEKSRLPETSLLPVSCRAGSFDGSAFILPSGLEPIEIERALAGIYAAAGRQYLSERTQLIASDMGMNCPPVALSGAKKQWGSCTHNKRSEDRICYSWRLMLASPRAVDSVIVHELCHVGEMSHGERFWRHVKSYMPDYSESHEELRRLAATMARRFHV